MSPKKHDVAKTSCTAKAGKAILINTIINYQDTTFLMYDSDTKLMKEQSVFSDHMNAPIM